MKNFLIFSSIMIIAGMAFFDAKDRVAELNEIVDQSPTISAGTAPLNSHPEKK